MTNGRGPDVCTDKYLCTWQDWRGYVSSGRACRRDRELTRSMDTSVRPEYVSYVDVPTTVSRATIEIPVLPMRDVVAGTSG